MKPWWVKFSMQAQKNHWRSGWYIETWEAGNELFHWSLCPLPSAHNKARESTEQYTKPMIPHCTKAKGTTRTHAVLLLLSVHGLSWLTFNFLILCVCSGNFSSAPKHNPNRKTIEFSDWLHMECLQRPTVHLGWLSSFFKTIWSLLKLSLFKEPAERGESNLGLRRKRRNKI